ncbi:hypothetical protein OPT61_g2894 [Boeremia exigua]|uniref:Uncharacterized protein n=1 Tax=Boeremia exigua TaxID=749465 RepID=A0ACC2IK37_9PLEO|nr:hypothetical protein OPT61_g2894 [Boeremia exigua]
MPDYEVFDTVIVGMTVNRRPLWQHHDVAGSTSIPRIDLPQRQPSLSPTLLDASTVNHMQISAKFSRNNIRNPGPATVQMTGPK